MERIAYIYSTGWSVPMAAVGAVAAPTVLLEADGNFLCEYLTVSVRQGAAGAELIVATFAGDLQVTLNVSGFAIMNVATPVHALDGSGQLPYWFKPPRVIPGGSTITCTVTSNVVTRTQVAVSFHGSKEKRVS